MYGKMYVRGHDRDGRPIIHYRPGLERSFDTEKVHHTEMTQKLRCTKTMTYGNPCPFVC